MQLAAALAAVYLIWGSTYLAIRFAIETMPPLLMAGVRFFLSGIILYVWMMFRGASRPTLRQWKSAAIIGGLLLLGGNGGVVWAERKVPSGLAALLVSTVSIWMVLVDWIRPNGRRPSWGVVLGILIGFSGMILLVDPFRMDLSRSVDLHGVAVLNLASFMWAIGSIYSRHTDLPSSPFVATGMEMIAGGLILCLAGFAMGEANHFSLAAISSKSWAAFIYLMVFGSLVGFTAYIWILSNATVAVASTYSYVNPVVALFLGWWLVGEPLSHRTLGGAGLVLIGVMMIGAMNSRRKLGRIQD